MARLKSTAMAAIRLQMENCVCFPRPAFSFRSFTSSVRAAAVAGERQLAADHAGKGTMMGMGVLWFAWPTARKALGLPLRGRYRHKRGLAEMDRGEREPAFLLKPVPTRSGLL